MVFKVCVLLTWLTLLNLASSCQTKHDPQKASNHASKGSSKKEAPSFVQPLVFARYPKNAAPQKESIYYNVPRQEELYLCNKSPLFNRETLYYDICSGTILSLKELDTKPYAYPWGLVKTPEAFYWQQEIPKGYQLNVELEDEGGLALPAELKIEQKRLLHTAILKPLYELPQGKKLILHVKVFEKDLAKYSAWYQEIVIGKGAEHLPWESTTVKKITKEKQATSKKKKAPKKSHTRKAGVKA